MNRVPVLVGAAIAVLLALLTAAVPAHAAFPQNAKVVRKKDNDRVRFVSAPRGQAMPRPRGYSSASDPRDVGRAFLEENARDFGLSGSAVSAVRRTPDLDGGTAVRYQQRIGGVKVLGGQFVVRLDADNRILTAQGEAEPDSAVDTDAKLSARDAERRAIEAVARHEKVQAALLKADGTEMMVFNDRLVGGPGLDRAVLVWGTHVSDGLAIKKLVLVDADTGGIMAEIEEAPEAKNRSICDAANQPLHLPCTAPVLSEGGTYSGTTADVQPAYNYSGAFYDFLMNKFGRDSLDGAGMPLKSTVRYCDPNYTCPFANAFWNGEQMVYGDGYASADDVVGHELAHGYTEFTSGLLYYFQSGAINESMSDIFGELLDIDTSSPNDAAGDAWKMGESLPIGAIRNMKDPTIFGHPDHMLSDHWFLDTFMEDSGGVHLNSGVGNKAAYLMVDGGTFNSVTVTGIGKEKTARIYDKVQTSFLTSGSDYVDLGLALGAACDALVGTAGITTADCTEVRDAVTATKMLTDRPEAADLPECTTGSPVYAYDDSFEGETVAWDTSLVGGEPAWGIIPDYATTGRKSLYSPNRDGSAAKTEAYMTQSVSIPSGAYLSFQTAWEFEGPHYDGGVVEVSTNGGSTWSPMEVTGYNGTISASYGNPLGGRNAFVARSNGYRRIVTSLSSLAGQSARFRFVYGHDEYVKAWLGWVIDDVRVLTCGAQAKPVVSTAAATAVSQTGATLNGTVNPKGAATKYKFEYGPNGTFTQSTPEVELAGGNSPVAVSAAITGLSAATSYSFRLVATNSGGTETSSAQQFTTSGSEGSAPAAAVLPVTGITQTAATLKGTVNPNGQAATYKFEYGPNGTFTQSTPVTNLSAGSTAVDVQAPVSGLTAATTYSYRLVATNATGTTTSSSSTFTTSAANPGDPAPTVTTLAATNVVSGGARLNGAVNPNGVETSVVFEVGEQSNLSDAAPLGDPVSAGSGTSTAGYYIDISWDPAVIPAGTTIYYRFVGLRGDTRHPGSILSFTTPSGGGNGGGSLAAPAATTLGSSNVSATGATVSGMVDPNGLQTTYFVEYGAGGQLTSVSPPLSLPAGADPVAVSVALTGLSPSTNYSYRVKALNSMGEAVGSIMSFTTAAASTGTTPPDTTPGTPTTPTTPVTPVTPVTEVPAKVAGTAKPVKRGKSAKVSCANSGGKASCKVTFPGAKRKRKVSATLKLGSRTVAKGSVKKANARGQVSLRGATSLAPGSYTLTVKVGRKSYRFKLALK